jgi:glycosyltransferase involved in cell wall biosynthesis
MRVVMTIPHYWPYVRRGSERVVHDLSTCLQQRGHAVTVVTRTPQGRRHAVDDAGVRVVYRRTRRPSRLLRGFEELELFAFDAGLETLRTRADVYHAFYLTDAYGMASALRMRSAPMVLSVHGPPSRSWWSAEHPRTNRWFERTLRRAARVTVLSEDSAKRLREDYGHDPVVVMPGIFCDDFATPRRPGPARRVVCAAAIDDGRKRIDVLLDAFELVASDEEDLELVLAGPGDASAVEARVERMAAEVGRRVRRRDVPTRDLPALLSECTVAALTSEMEAFGLVLVEAMAAGLPVIGTDHGGIPEVIAPGTGSIFRRGDVDDCAAALRTALRLAADPQTEARCRAHARTFDWSTRVDTYLRLYEDVLG